MEPDILKLQLRRLELSERIETIKKNQIQIEENHGYVSITDEMDYELLKIDKIIADNINKPKR
jgi:hypothetical protein